METDEKLRDGTLVRLRPLRADDKARLAEGVRRLADRSSRSLYLRFLRPVSDLDEKTLRYLTEIDQVNHLAWIALDPTTPGEPALGVARCVRLAEDPKVAEIAILVSDRVQDRGLGSLLLERLAGSAEEQGIATFRAVVLRENSVVVHSLQEIGVRGEAEQGVLQVDVPVAEVRELARAARTAG